MLHADAYTWRTKHAVAERHAQIGQEGAVECQQSLSRSPASQRKKNKKQRRQRSRNWIWRENEKAKGVKVTFSRVQHFENRCAVVLKQHKDLKMKSFGLCFVFSPEQPVTPNFDEKTGTFAKRKKEMRTESLEIRIRCRETAVGRTKWNCSTLVAWDETLD